MEDTLNTVVDFLSKTLEPWKHNEPYFVSGRHEWWVDADTNKYIYNKENLDGYNAWFVREDKDENRVIRVITKYDKAIHETKSLEDQACYIDILSVIEGVK